MFHGKHLFFIYSISHEPLKPCIAIKNVSCETFLNYKKIFANIFCLIYNIDMEKKFYREINANSISGANITIPDAEELKNALIEKLREKSNHINVLISKTDRDEYLAKKGKLEESKKLSEKEVKSLLAKRLVVDILQLFWDLSKAFGEKVQLILEPKNNFTEQQVQQELLWCCEKLITKKTKSEIFEVIANNIAILAKTYNFTFDELEAERIKVEKEEGNFYNGKFVIS